MSRLEDYLYPEESRDFDIYDVSRLKTEIRELASVPAPLVAKMYSDYSDMYSASWLIVDEDSIESFRRWLL